MSHNTFNSLQSFDLGNGKEGKFYSLPALAEAGLGDVSRLPACIRLVLESVLRNFDGQKVTEENIRQLAAWQPNAQRTEEIPFTVARIVLQDFTGVPLLVDLAAMRSAVQRLGKDPKIIEPLVPVDLVVDHSVQVDFAGSEDAMDKNLELEFKRNRERYQFLKWGMQAFDTFKVVPPGIGIVHQVNLEYLARGVLANADGIYYPDTLVGTDSHTTMINGLGIVGWGVGGIEAEAGMLGQPVYFLTPDVVGVQMEGSLREGVTATDLALTVTEMLREAKVVGKFVEFYGQGAKDLPLTDRATIANMAPEYGATMGYFPVDEQTLKYMELTGRSMELIETVKQYTQAQGLWHDPDADVVYTAQLELDLSTVVPAMAGPKRPQDRILLTDMKSQWEHDMATSLSPDRPAGAEAVVEHDGETFDLEDGDVVIAAITSCTNTSNPDVMMAAGLLARKARDRGLDRKPWVKTSLAPGSKVVTEYLERSGLLDDLEAVGFYVVGYGCTTCIGNSGPLPDPIHVAINENDLVATSVLSGNRNFEGRISPDIRANYLASPPLVVAYALAGSVDMDLTVEPLGTDPDGNEVFLRDIWPTQEEIDAAVRDSLGRDQFIEQYSDVYSGSNEWQDIETSGGQVFEWSDESTYIHRPPFFAGMTSDVPGIHPVRGARVLGMFGDSVTTDHISPAGAIGSDSPAGRWLQEHGVPVSMFNSFGSRRGNDLIMTRGTFGNIRVRNLLAPGTEGGWTTDFTDGEVKSIFEASCSYKEAGIPLVVLTGKDYGMGSSRDWAAKGTFLLGVRAVIAESYERIHRSNLVGMGVVPLQYAPGDSAQSLGLDGTESFDINVDDDLSPRQTVHVVAEKSDGSKVEFDVTCRADTPVEIDYLKNGGILHTVLRRMATG